MADGSISNSTNLFDFGQQKPLGPNPFSLDHPAYQAFEEANWEAEAKIALLGNQLVKHSGTAEDIFKACMTYAFTHADVSADCALKVITDEETKRWYDDWLSRCIQLEVSRIYAWANEQRIDRNALDLEMMRKAGEFRAKAAFIVAQLVEKRRVDALAQKTHRVVTPSKRRLINRAGWLRQRLEERGWNEHEVEKRNGPDHKTVKKILDGLPVQEGVLGRLATALSRKREWRTHQRPCSANNREARR